MKIGKALLPALIWALALLTAPASRADVYSDVTQMISGGRLVDAETRADQHLKTKPRDPQMRYLKGLIQRETGRQSEALDTFTQLTEEYPELPEPYNAMAVILAAQGSYKPAVAALEKALHANPSYATAQQNLGDVYGRMALQSYCKALQLNPQNSSELKTRIAALGYSCP